MPHTHTPAYVSLSSQIVREMSDVIAYINGSHRKIVLILKNCFRISKPYIQQEQLERS
jgi:hypothetical protein